MPKLPIPLLYLPDQDQDFKITSVFLNWENQDAKYGKIPE